MALQNQPKKPAAEYKSKCDMCGTKKGNTHARSFWRKIHKKWMWLCKECWEKQ